MNMKSLGMFNLLRKLSNLGVETLDFLSGKTTQTFPDTIRALCTNLFNLKGEATSVAIAEEILALYRTANDEDKKVFFRFIHEHLGVDHQKITAAIAGYQSNPGQATAQELAKACEAARRELLRTLNTAPGGTLALIEMREDLKRLMSDDAAFTTLDRELFALFTSWFNRGFLQLRRIDWKTPAFILEKLIEYESVHEIKGWPDLRRRLEKDRGCYGFFHPAIPDVPLIFVEAALTNGISTNVTQLLLQEAPKLDLEPPTTAVFYSINNCLQGLRGVSFGNFLIKQVIEHLGLEVPSITQFVTLSPLPGFMLWLQQAKVLPELLNPAELELVQALLANRLNMKDLEQQPLLQVALPRLCAHYLVNEKSRGNPADPVARFHLGNGARLEQINWMADNSANGIRQSAGMMVNYLYDRKHLARNHEAYEQNKVIAHSPAIRKLLQSRKPAFS